ncbi:MAG: type II secretion system minor pseudopilin GspI [Pseudomonadota bacterium]
MRSAPASRQSAFTLIEVIVALFIVALGIGALLSTLTTSAGNLEHLRDKSFAQWVALNHVTEVRLGIAPSNDGKSSGEVQFAGNKWYWRQDITNPNIAGMHRIDVSVSRTAGEEAPAQATAVGFVGTALAKPSGVDPDWTLQSLPEEKSGKTP